MGDDARKRWNPPPLNIRLAAAVADAILMHPIGTIKVRMQMGMGSGILQNLGYGSLYKGFSAGLLRRLSSTTVIGLYSSSSFQSDALSKGNNVISLAASISPLTLAAVMVNPIDVAATRMQGDLALNPDLRRNYKNVMQAIYRAAADEGLLALWRGTCPNVLALWGNVLGFVAVATCLHKIIQTKYSKETKIIGACLMGGLLPPMIGQPFNYVKTQMQMMQADSRGRYPYTSSLDCAMKTMKLSGPLKLYRGFAAYSLTITPHVLLILWLQSKARGMEINIKT